MRHNSNSLFWSEPCGYVAAQQFGFNLNTAIGIQEFDKWFFSFYPYLGYYLPESYIKNKNVLEVGIGSGSVSRHLAAHAKTLMLLDIAPGAIEFVKKTMKNRKNISYVCQDILEFKHSQKFDLVIAIGSLHHTGDLLNSLTKLEHLLGDDGTIIVMIYNAFQPKKIFSQPVISLSRYIQTIRRHNRKYVFRENDVKQKLAVDSNSKGEPAPIIDFSSKRLFKERPGFQYSMRLENINRIPYLSKYIKRNLLLKVFSNIFGPDIYAIGKRTGSQQLSSTTRFNAPG